VAAAVPVSIAVEDESEAGLVSTVVVPVEPEVALVWSPVALEAEQVCYQDVPV
jgi:hypothetical protein